MEKGWVSCRALWIGEKSSWNRLLANANKLTSTIFVKLRHARWLYKRLSCALAKNSRREELYNYVLYWNRCFSIISAVSNTPLSYTSTLFTLHHVKCSLRHDLAHWRVNLVKYISQKAFISAQEKGIFRCTLRDAWFLSKLTLTDVFERSWFSKDGKVFEGPC